MCCGQRAALVPRRPVISGRAFASWLGLCPEKQISGGKVLFTRTRKVKNRIAGALRMGASCLYHAQNYLGEFYRRMKRKLGAPKAVTATAHKLLVLSTTYCGPELPTTKRLRKARRVRSSPSGAEVAKASRQTRTSDCARRDDQRGLTPFSSRGVGQCPGFFLQADPRDPCQCTSRPFSSSDGTVLRSRLLVTRRFRLPRSRRRHTTPRH